MSNIKTASLEQLRAMRERGETSPARKDAKEIDLPNGFWESAKVVEPPSKKAISMRVDPDIIDFFKDEGDGYQTRMHAVLRAYVDGMKHRSPS